MSQSGRSCRKIDRSRTRAEDLFDIELARDKVLVRFRGRLVRTLTGADVEAVRAIVDDPDRLQRLVARRTGNFKRGNER